MKAKNMLRTYAVKIDLFRFFGFDVFVDVTECLSQIEILGLLHTCAPCAELPSNISSMVHINITLTS